MLQLDVIGVVVGWIAVVTAVVTAVVIAVVDAERSRCSRELLSDVQ